MREPGPPLAQLDSLPSVVLITGTSTGVGKTVATAALAGSLLDRGCEVAVYKPAQTGVSGHEPGDIDEVCRLLGRSAASVHHGVPGAGPTLVATSGVGALEAARATFVEGVRLRDPLAPSAAARREGRSLPTIADHVRAVILLARDHDVVLVEGAGGLLVPLDEHGGTLADLGVALRRQGTSAGALLVCAAGLGTLNHTALTAEALRHRGVPLLGLIVGAWPTDPDSVDISMRENLLDLPRVADAPLVGVLPAGVGGSAAGFRRGIPGWLGPRAG